MVEFTPADGTDLMERIRQRDHRALEALYQHYAPVVYNLALRVVGHRNAAEEVTQDVFFQVWRWPEKWDPQRGALFNWLLTVTRHTAIDRLRREQRQATYAPEHLDAINHQLSHTAPADVIEDDLAILRDLVKRLPREQREIIDLAFFAGLTHSQIAERLALPVGTVKSRLRLALEKLRSGWLMAVHVYEQES